jgi:hypothetical protein
MNCLACELYLNKAVNKNKKNKMGRHYQAMHMKVQELYRLQSALRDQTGTGGPTVALSRYVILLKLEYLQSCKSFGAVCDFGML